MSYTSTISKLRKHGYIIDSVELKPVKGQRRTHFVLRNKDWIRLGCPDSEKCFSLMKKGIISEFSVIDNGKNKKGIMVNVRDGVQFGFTEDGKRFGYLPELKHPKVALSQAEYDKPVHIVKRKGGHEVIKYETKNDDTQICADVPEAQKIQIVPAVMMSDAQVRESAEIAINDIVGPQSIFGKFAKFVKNLLK